jgi:hypothetical protein
MDNFDIAFLCEHLEITSIAQAVEIYETYYPEDPLPKYALPILQAILQLDKEADHLPSQGETHPRLPGWQSRKR